MRTEFLSLIIMTRCGLEWKRK